MAQESSKEAQVPNHKLWGERGRSLHLETGAFKESLVGLTNSLPPGLYLGDSGYRGDDRIRSQMQAANPTVTLSWSPENLRPQHCNPRLFPSPSPGCERDQSHNKKVPDLPSQDHMAE